MIFFIVGIIVIGAFPMMGKAACEKRTAKRERAGEITINNITILSPPSFEKDGIYRNHIYAVDVNFTLSDSINNTNLTLNISLPGGGYAENISALGNLTAGNYNETMVMYFMVPGFYTIKGTVEGWNGTGMTNDSAQLENVEFRDVISFRVSFKVEGPNVNGVFGKDDSKPVRITIDANNSGNVKTDGANVTVNIRNTTNNVSENNVKSMAGTPWHLHATPLEPGGGFQNVLFIWIPSVEGENSEYNITVTVTDPVGAGSGSNRSLVKVTNVIDMHQIKMEAPFEVNQGEDFDVNVWLNNTGNCPGQGEVHVVIYHAENPANEVYNEKETSEPISPKGGPGRNARQQVLNITFRNIMINEPGDFKIKAMLLGTQEFNMTDLIVYPRLNIDPVLESVLLAPDPNSMEVKVGEHITFSVNYSDGNGENGNVTLNIRKEGESDFDICEMDLVETPPYIFDWIKGVQFNYTWIPTDPGSYYFYFYGEDNKGGNFTLLDEEFEYFHLEILEITEGWVKGIVKEMDTGEPVKDTKVVIYCTRSGENNVTVIDQYHNVTTNETGFFERMAPLSENKYVIRIDEEWMGRNNYAEAIPAIDNFFLNAVKPVEWKNFTLERPDVGKAKTFLNGTVKDTGGKALSDVLVTVAVFKDRADHMTFQKEINGTLENVIIDITVRTWMNLSTTTDANGTFSMVDIPLASPGDVLPETGKKTYRHDVEAPEAGHPGLWNVIANRSGYSDNTTSIQFRNGRTTFWNVTMETWTPPPTYTIDGTVEPPDANITIMPVFPVKQDPATGNFTIDNLENGEYMVRIDHDGYYSVHRKINIDNSDYDMGEITLVPYDEGINTTSITVGRFVDHNGDGISGITVSFTLKDEIYSGVTGADGNVTFEVIGYEEIPNGTVITFGKGERLGSGIWPLSDEDRKYFASPPPKEDEGANTALFIAVVVVILVTMIVLAFLLIRSRGVEEEEEEEFREYECPSCGTIVTSEMGICPECGETFEEEEFLCPECGEAVEEFATACGSCDTEFDIPEKVEEEEDEEEGDEEEEPGGDTEAVEGYDEDEYEDEEEDEEMEEPDEEEESVIEYQCPECGGVVAESDTSCLGCGTGFEE